MTTKANDNEKTLTSAEKKQILREAVSWYLRNDFRDAVIREVCEEFIADIDDEARGSVGGEARPSQAHISHTKKP